MTFIKAGEIREVILSLAYTLRSLGERVGTAELVEAERILRDYMILRYTGGLRADELLDVIAAVWPPASRRRKELEAELDRIMSSKNVDSRLRTLFNEILEEADMLGAKPGERVSLKRAVRGRKKERARIKASYVKLKRIGAITGRAGKERLLDRAALRNLALKLARAGYESLDDAVKSIKLPKSKDALMLQMESGISLAREQLENMSESRLLKTGWAALKKRDHKTQSIVASILRERINRGEPLRDPEGVIEFLEKSHNLTSDVLIGVLSQGEPVKGLDLETIANAISKLDTESAGSLLAKYRKMLTPDEFLELLSMSDPRNFWALPSRGLGSAKGRLIEAAVNAAKALREARLYLDTHEEGRADMAHYYADKAEALLEGAGGVRLGRVNESSVKAIIAEARRLVALAEGTGGGLTPARLDSAVAALGLADAVKMLKALYSRASSEEQRRIIIMSMEKILARAASRSGLLPTSKRVYNTKRGRLELRRTIYNILRRKPEPIVFVSRAKSNPVALGVDVSSSMIEYSSWAIAVASMFSRHVEKLVFFSHEVQSYTGPFSKRDMARLLLEAEFGGRTNISAALRVLSERVAARRVVLVSDLAQTVEDEPPWLVVSSLRARGIKPVFITHERHDRDARRLLEAEGARVLVARSPREAAKKVLVLLR
ncbi:MAG: VWA domain-containing protein [Desulfurococcales archaeon]|nr:VWA domain-containing protein [Desulfurococcales archaeon]